MKNKVIPINLHRKIIIVSCIILLTAYAAIAQNDPPVFDDDIEDTPLDGGVAALVIAASAYAYRSINQQKK